MDKSGAVAPGQQLAGISLAAPPSAAPPPPTRMDSWPAGAIPKPNAAAAAAPAPAAEAPPTPTPGKLNLSALGGATPPPVKPLEGTPPSSSSKFGSGKLAVGKQADSGGGGKSVLNRTRRISEKASKELNEVFQSFDVDGSGTIELEELVVAVEKLGMQTPKEKLVAMLQVRRDASRPYPELRACDERVEALS